MVFLLPPLFLSFKKYGSSTLWKISFTTLPQDYKISYIWGKQRQRDYIICPTLYIKPTNKLKLPSQRFSSKQFTGQYFTLAWRHLRCCWRQHFCVLFGCPGPKSPLLVPKPGTFTKSSQIQYFSSTNKIPRPGGDEAGDIEYCGGDVKSVEDLAVASASHCQPWLTLQSQPSACMVPV